MTRILYWNIENFSVNKFWQPNLKRRRDGTRAGGPFTQCSLNRLNYFFQVLDDALVLNNNRVPEIVVIIELESGVTGRGTLVTGNGPTATQSLVDEVRTWTGNNNWMVVPPLYTGPTEGVIVLYDSTNLIFTGPNRWPGGGPSAVPLPRLAAPLVAPASQYPASWNGYIRTGVLNRVIPGASLYNSNYYENEMAARVAGFTSSAGASLVPLPGGMPALGAPMDGNLGPRTPYMVTFFRPAAGMAAAENITLCSIRAPANNNAARNYMTALACTQEISNAPVGNERKVVVGDFNFNLFTNAGVVPQRYQYFQQLGYGTEVAPVPLVGFVAPAPPLGYFEYFATHLAKQKNAVSWSDAHTQRYYPGYGYVSDRYKCIDNIFVRGGALANTTVLNPVVGSPYNVVPAPVPVWLTPVMQGHFTIDCLCPCYNAPNPVPAWQAPRYGTNQAEIRQVFRGWNNFGRIRSTSDHLPIMAEF